MVLLWAIGRLGAKTYREGVRPSRVSVTIVFCVFSAWRNRGTCHMSKTLWTNCWRDTTSVCGRTLEVNTCAIAPNPHGLRSISVMNRVRFVSRRTGGCRHEHRRGEHRQGVRGQYGKLTDFLYYFIDWLNSLEYREPLSYRTQMIIYWCCYDNMYLF